MKVGTKTWDIFEACLDRRLSPAEELDTDDLMGKRFHAMVSVKRTGKGNRTEHGTIGPYRPKSEPNDDLASKDRDEGDSDFGNLPL